MLLNLFSNDLRSLSELTTSLLEADSLAHIVRLLLKTRFCIFKENFKDVVASKMAYFYISYKVLLQFRE